MESRTLLAVSRPESQLFPLAISTMKKSRYPEPIAIPPKSGQHKQTIIIILHGRGSNVSTFSQPLLDLETSKHGRIQDKYPNAKLIFPTASKRRAIIYNRSFTNQWFDNWSLDKPQHRVDIQYEGLCETADYIHGLLQAEIADVGAENTVLWGLSQGGAASLVSMLLWEGERIAAWIGMCTWLPLRKEMEESVHPNQADNIFGADDDDPFGNVEESALKVEQSGFEKAVACLHDLLDPPDISKRRKSFGIPVFLGHGEDDDRVPLHLFEESTAFLDLLDVDTTSISYPEFGHWYSQSMISDILDFIEEKTGWNGRSEPYIERHRVNAGLNMARHYQARENPDFVDALAREILSLSKT